MNLPVPGFAFAACAFSIGSALTGYADQFGDFTYVENDTTIEITDYPENATGDVIVPGEIVGKLVTSIGEEAFRRCDSLTSVTIPDSVNSIGDSAFSNCLNLTRVTIGNNVTSIGERAFWFCDSLTSATIPGSVTEIKEGTFFGCTRLTSVTIGNGVTSIGDGAFAVCASLSNLAIPDSVTSIGEAAFSECTSLTSVTIPDGVTSIGAHAFEICTRLTSVTIPNSVTTIGVGAFIVCKSLPSVTVPDSVTSIGYRAFFGCTGLTSVTIPDGVTHIGDGAFRACGSLTAITVNEANPSYSSVDGVLLDKNQTTLLQFPGGKTGSYTIPDSVTRILEQAFRNCDSVEDVTVSAAVKANLEDEVCRDISITMGSGVTSIEPGVFGGCTNLTSITIGTGVTSIGGWAFHDCDNLRVVTIPGNVTSIGEKAFVNCGNLTSVTIGNGVTAIGESAFGDCVGLTSVTIPESVTSIGVGAFVNCSSLRAIYFEGNALILGWRLFDGAHKVIVYHLLGKTGWAAEFNGRPTAEISVLPDPLIGGTPVNDQEGWFLSGWWGGYNPAYAPWLLHAEHGFIYRHPSSANAGLYMFDDAMGAWWWTSETMYPFIYAFDPPPDHGPGTDIEDEWLFYFEDSIEPRLFGVVTGASAGSFLFFDP